MGNLDAPSGLHWSDVSVAPPPSCVVSSLFKLFKLFSPLPILSARQPSRATMVRRLGCLSRSTRGFFSRLVVLVICLTSCRRLCAGLPRFFFGAGALCIFLGEYIFYFILIWSMRSSSSPHQTTSDSQISRLEVLGALLLTSPSAVAL